MRKALATVIVGAVAAVGISAGAVFLTPATADAQEDTATETGPLEEILGDLVTEGVINQEQADAIAERLRQAGPFHGPHHKRGGHLETVADILGMEPSELLQALRDGDSVADVAGDQTDDVIDALVDEAAGRLDRAVESGRINQDEADEKLTEIRERITEMVNGEIDFSERRRPGTRGGSFGPPPADEVSSPAA